MKISELAERTGLSVHTIRYYERIGLLPYAARNQAKHRDYDASILAWMDLLGRLKTTGMPLRDMLAYAQMRADPATGAKRRALLARHRAGVAARIAELSACLTVLDEKIASYGGSPSATEQAHDDAKHAERHTLRKRQARAG
jgi:DNA-binding transcriptional MerR regulator